MTEEQETGQEVQVDPAALAAELEAERAAHQATRADLTAALAGAAGRYREVLLAANPQVPPELVAGESIEALDAALESARKVVADVLHRNVAPAHPEPVEGPSPAGPPAVPAGAPSGGGSPSPVEGRSLSPVEGSRPGSSPPVPAGAPVRSGPDTSAMSAVEKIKFGLAG